MSRAYSNSELSSYRACPLQWKFHWDLKLRKRDDEAADHHLRFGNAIHKGLEAIYRGGSLRAAQERFLEFYPRQLDSADKAKTRQNGVTALANYVTRWKDEDKAWKVLEIETRSDDPWSVKPDMVVENVQHGGTWLVDHKTTGAYLNYAYWEKYQPNSQITHYLDYAQSKYGAIEGFIINAIGFKFRERAYKGEPAGFWTAFERQTFNRQPAQLEFERKSRVAWIDDLERSVASSFYRTNTDACFRCTYKSLCAPGWTWEDDRELIEIGYYQACDALLAGDEHCVLELNHDGDHSPEQLVTAEIEVEL